MNKNTFTLIKYTSMLIAAVAGFVATWASDEEIKIQAHNDVLEYLKEKETNTDEK